MEPRKPKTCKCGYARSHEHIVEEPEYTLWGWFQISIIGITPKPDHIVFRCQICRQSVGVSRDPALLRRKTQPPERPADKQEKT